MRRTMNQSDVNELIKHKWVVLTGEYRRGKLKLRKPKIVYKITHEGMLNYMSIIKVLGEPDGILNGRGVDYIDSIETITPEMIEYSKEMLMSKGILVQTSDRIELSEAGFRLVKTMFELDNSHRMLRHGTQKIDWSEKKSGSSKADKFNKGMTVALKGIFKVMEAGNKMDEMFNGKQKNKNTTPKKTPRKNKKKGKAKSKSTGPKRYKQTPPKRFEDEWDYGKL